MEGRSKRYKKIDFLGEGQVHSEFSHAIRYLMVTFKCFPLFVV